MSNSQQLFMAMIHADFNRINLQLSYIDMCDGDHVAGILLSQIVYWHLPNRDTGRSKLRVKQDGHYWIVKGREDWYKETRITDRQYDRAIKVLKLKGIVKVEKFLYWDRAKGNSAPAPTLHLRLDWDVFTQQYSKVVDNLLQHDEEEYFDEEKDEKEASNPSGSRFSPNGENDITKRGERIPQTGRTLKLSDTTLTKTLKPSLSNTRDNKFKSTIEKWLGTGHWRKQHELALEIAIKFNHSEGSLSEILEMVQEKSIGLEDVTIAALRDILIDKYGKVKP